MRFLIPVLFLLFACKSEKTDRSAFSPDNIKSEFFKVKAGEAATITTRQGGVIEIPACDELFRFEKYPMGER
ncbi:MAG: hypothetical protein IPJ82_19835 [Lewinellaceae bacterium]|nr:hypothetical protein [Lewinellaceae bacterium]